MCQGGPDIYDVQAEALKANSELEPLGGGGEKSAFNTIGQWFSGQPGTGMPALGPATSRKTPGGRTIYYNMMGRGQEQTYSSERSTTFNVDGKWYNYPTIHKGEVRTIDDAIGIFMLNNGVDPETGSRAKAFDSLEEAETAAAGRSETLDPYMPGQPSNTPRRQFDPEGTGYDYESAKQAGISPDDTGHWASRVPKTGLILKGRGHETFHKTIAGEKEAGYEMTKGKDGRYYSKKRR